MKSDVQVTNKAPVALPAQRWDGTTHSAANAIAAALRLLQSDDPETASPTLGELVAICSELVFRATGERIRPALDLEDAARPTSMILWRSAADDLPDSDRNVLVRMDDGGVDCARYVPDWEEDHGTQWSCDSACGAHPGDYTDGDGVGRRCEVLQWADFPPDQPSEGQ